MNILSLFDGISCGQVALNRAGIKYDNYFASEVDKYAIKVTQHNYPNTIQLGDIKEITSSNLPTIDILFGGSPCQNLSFAGNMKGMTTKDNYEITTLDEYLRLKNDGFEFQGQSYLFWEYVRILKEVKPKYFLLENVKMLKKWENMISDVLGVKPIEINSALVSAQNRRRLYWTNIPNVIQPENKKIILKDILVDGVVDSRMTINEKAYALTASYNGAVAWNSIERKQRTMVLYAMNGKKVEIDLFNEPPFSFYETRTEEGKEMRRKIRMETGKDSTPRSKEFKMYVTNKSGKGNCLVTVESPLDFIVDPNWKYRKLYPIEMERLQTIPDGYTSMISDSQARKMLGNGWTVDVVAHIFKNIQIANKVYLIDIDGTICEDIRNEDSHLYPFALHYEESRILLNKWYDEGNIITFFTARESKDRHITEDWLRLKGFKFHGLIMDKPRCKDGQIYHWIDNRPVRATTYKGNWTELKQIYAKIETFE